MAREDKNAVGFIVALISEFAQHYGVHPRQAYAYLKRFKGSVTPLPLFPNS